MSVMSSRDLLSSLWPMAAVKTMVFMGTGTWGLIPAEDIKKNNRFHIILEKSTDVGDCWL